MALSLRKMSGILMEIYCCLPKPYLLLTCHNVASAFFRLLESVKLIPLGNGSTGLWEGRSYHACQWKRNTGLNPAGNPALATPPPKAKGSLGSSEMWLVLPTRHAAWYYTDPTPPMLILARFSHEVKDNGISG